MSSDLFWVPHPEQVFAVCRQDGTSGKDTVFAIQSTGEKINHPTDQVAKLDKVREQQLLGVDNVCDLEEVNQAALLQTIRVRYGQTKIYTRVARILIAANPFQRLPLYTPEFLRKYQGVDSMELEPHIYSIGLDAVNGLISRAGKQNQAVLISGESGAGKTESTKLVLGYVGDALSGASSEGGIQDKIMQTNPILESFGNAMTVRNNNSSRFGKWLQILVTGDTSIQGCSVTDYLLELTRVTGQGSKERNYHVFFQLIECRNDDVLKPLALNGASDYEYTKHCMEKAPGIDDREFFEDLRSSFTGLGFDSNLQTEIFKMVAGIMTMGNFDFKDENDKSVFKDEAPLASAASLLGIDVEVLKKPMITRRLMVGKDVTEADRTAAQSKMAKDGFARLLYGRLFKWLVRKINQLLGKDAKYERFFGVLDIAGFESFETNSLEQLFINLSNEHLQQHFNNFIFKQELEDYKAEGIDCSQFAYSDNKDIVELIDTKGGILSMLDEEGAMPKATDATFCSKVFKAHDKHKRLIVPKFQGAVQFGIRHFAGEVQYSAVGFLEKNVDKPPDEAPGMMQGSSLGLLKEIGDEIAAEVAEANSGGGRKKQKTVSLGFRASLAELVKKLGEAEPHFIRCMKPNYEKVPQKFTSKLAMDQLLCSGVFEAVRIRQSGYSSRIPFGEFIGRYRVILPKATQEQVHGKKASGTEAERVKKLVAELPSALASVGGVAENEILLGKTKLFTKGHVKNALDRRRDLAISGFAVDIQRFYRGYIVRKRMKDAKAVYSELTQWIQRNQFYTKPGKEETALYKLKSVEAIEKELEALDAILLRGDKLPIPLPKNKNMEKVRQRMENEAKEVKGIRGLVSSLDPVEIQGHLKRLEDLDIPIDTLPDVVPLRQRIDILKKQLPLIHAMKSAIQSEDQHDLEEAMKQLRELGYHQKPEMWIAELKGEELSGTVYECLQRVKEKNKQKEIKEKQAEEASLKSVKEEQGKKKAGFAQVEEEEKFSLIKAQKRKTVEDNSAKMKKELTEVGEYFSATAIHEKLKEATLSGITDCDEFKEAQALYEDLQSEEFLKKKLEECMAEVAEGQAPGDDTLKRLQNLIGQASALNVAEEAALEAKRKIASGVRQRARMTLTGRVFQDVAVEDLRLLSDTFNLSTFARLKDLETWKGHRGYVKPKGEEESTAGHSRRTIIADAKRRAMLVHSKFELRDSLTQLQSHALETRAVNTFHEILGWMGDKPMPESQRLTYAQDLIQNLKQDGKERSPLADEVFCQLMKQLTTNPETKLPSGRARVQGWKLLHMLTQTVAPTPDLEEYLRAFLIEGLAVERRAASAEGDEASIAKSVASIAQQCIADLNVWNPANQQSTGGDGQEKPVKVLLIDNSMRKLFIPDDATLELLGERLAEQLKISRKEDFAFYQLTEGLSVHRMLPSKTGIENLRAKFAMLEKATSKNGKPGRRSWILYKRHGFGKDEDLKPGDLMHAELSYKQALWDFLQYPLVEDTDLMCEVAALILHTEADHFEEALRKKRLDGNAPLQQLLPAVVIREQKMTGQLSKLIMAAYDKLKEKKVIQEDETRLERISHAFKKMQGLKLFGAQYWMCKELPKATGKEVLKNAPSSVCKINPKAPLASYWICVDRKGLRLVAADSKPGAFFQRGFDFEKESLERVLLWSADKENVLLHLVVSTVNADNPGAGRVPMSIVLSSPAAMDVAFAIQCAFEQSRSGGR